jgi:hypothetical protein
VTKAEFIQRTAIDLFCLGQQHAAEAWKMATELANAAPAGTFDTAPAASSRPVSAGKSGITVPFGRNKGMAIEDAPESDLRYLVKRSIETLFNARVLVALTGQFAFHLGQPVGQRHRVVQALPAGAGRSARPAAAPGRRAR